MLKFTFTTPIYIIICKCVIIHTILQDLYMIVFMKQHREIYHMIL